MEGAAALPLPPSPVPVEDRQPPAEAMDGSQGNLSSRRSSFLERRRVRLDTSDTSVERQKPVKKKGMFQKAKALIVPRETSDELRSSSEDEILTLIPVQLHHSSAVPRQGTPGSAA